MPNVRINKYIASCTEMSRRKVDSLISQGKVLVNSRRASVGDVVDTDCDIVMIDGKKVGQSKKHYLAMYKPKFVVTTMNDPEARSCIKDFVPGKYKGVFPVGRLDFDAQGLIILTNDGDFSQTIHHPSFKIPKVYEIRVFPTATDEAISRMKHGVMLDGVLAKAVSVKKIRQKGKASYLSITLEQGIKNQIKRMAKAVGLNVEHIKRTSIGPVRLGSMAPGSIRPLSNTEISEIYKYSEKRKT
jgi:23S rRNA pseudouridine2605 synthase